MQTGAAGRRSQLLNRFRGGSFLGTLLLITAAASSQAIEPTLEYQVKAVFLLRFAQFTEWPSDASRSNDEFVIGILGSDPFGEYLDRTVGGERINDRPISVRRFANVTEVTPVDLLFVADSHRQSLRQALDRVAGSPTLTIADYDGFAEQGGAIELFVDDGRVRFRVNRVAAEGAGLSLSSKLLRLAAAIEKG